MQCGDFQFFLGLDLISQSMLTYEISHREFSKEIRMTLKRETFPSGKSFTEGLFLTDFSLFAKHILHK